MARLCGAKQIVLWLLYVCIPPLVHNIVAGTVGVVLVLWRDKEAGNILRYSVARASWCKWREEDV